MRFEFEENGKPLFLQIADTIKDAIKDGSLQEEAQIPSSTEISQTYKLNPATVNKGVNLLVEEGIIYKKRGIGMFVSPGSSGKLRQAGQDGFYENFVRPLKAEAANLGITTDALIDLLKRED